MVRVMIVIIAFALVIGGCFLLINNEKAKTRDAKRLSDISRIQAAFEMLYNNTASYQPAADGGCNEVGSLASQCNLKQYIPGIAQFLDPGKYEYRVNVVPSPETYEITFTLEKTYQNLKAGKHTLSPAGIQ